MEENKLYASEILAIALQTGQEKVLENFGNCGGVLACLVCVSGYKRRDPEGVEEEEWLENVFDCLGCAVLDEKNKEKFLEAEGFVFLDIF